MKRGSSALVVIASIAIASCATNQSGQSPSPAASSPGIRTVEGRLFVGPGPHVEVPFKGGTLSAWPDLNKPYSVSVKMDDSKTEFGANSFDPGCPKLETCTSIHSHWLGAYDEQIVSGDGRPWPDTEMWAVVRDVNAPVGPKVLGMTRSRKKVAFEGCTNGKIYSSANLPALMSVLEGETNAPTTRPPQSLEGDKNVYFVDSAEDDPRPVCNWRHRVGLDAVLPAPKTTAARFYPASEKTPAHFEYVAKSATIDLFAKPKADRQNIYSRSERTLDDDQANVRNVGLPRRLALRTGRVYHGQYHRASEVLDGQTLGRSRLWEISSRNRRPKSIRRVLTGSLLGQDPLRGRGDARRGGRQGSRSRRHGYRPEVRPTRAARSSGTSYAIMRLGRAREKTTRSGSEARKAASERSKSDSQLKAPLSVSRPFN